MYDARCSKCGKRFFGKTPGEAESNMIRQSHEATHLNDGKLTLRPNQLPKLTAEILSHQYKATA